MRTVNLVLRLGLVAGMCFVFGCSSTGPNFVVRQAKPVCKILPPAKLDSIHSKSRGFGRWLPESLKPVQTVVEPAVPENGTPVAE